MAGSVHRVVEFDVGTRWRVDDEGVVLFVDTSLPEHPEQLFVGIPGLPEVRGLLFAATEMFRGVFEDVVCWNHVDSFARFHQVRELPARAIYHMSEQAIGLVVVAVLVDIQQVRQRRFLGVEVDDQHVVASTNLGFGQVRRERRLADAPSLGVHCISQHTHSVTLHRYKTQSDNVAELPN
jgi:hypothetical protein